VGGPLSEAEDLGAALRQIESIAREQRGAQDM